MKSLNQQAHKFNNLNAHNFLNKQFYFHHRLHYHIEFNKVKLLPDFTVDEIFDGHTWNRRYRQIHYVNY